MCIQITALFVDGTCLVTLATGWRDTLVLARWLHKEGAQVTFT